MSTSLEEFLRNQHRKVVLHLEDLAIYLQQATNLLSEAYWPSPTSHWPYTFHDGASVPKKDGFKLSVSTQAMCSAAVDRLLAGNDNKTLRDRQSKVLSAVFKDIEKQSGWKSGTFGENDIFTASWLVEVMAPRSDVPKQAAKIVVAVMKKALRKAWEQRFEQSLFDPPNEAGPHPLPVLRLLQACRMIEESPNLEKYWKSEKQDVRSQWTLSARRWFERNLHKQMSFFKFKDFRFDAAELVFCLAGLLETGGTTTYDDLLRQVLTIIRKAQTRSVYWRPYRPMKSDNRGNTLLPLSIEVASTLLEVLNRTEKFADYRDTLSRYYDWLVSQRILEDPQQPRSAEHWTGWHSENAYDTARIHVWDTARVAMFMLGYSYALKKQAQQDLREQARFSIIGKSEIESEPDVRIQRLVTYDEGSHERNFIDQIKQVIEKESFSLLLYGPPGVSKTVTAKAIALWKRWDMVYITPSDFISGGEANIEQKAKVMFDALRQMTDVLVFFDEIDRLLLDRDSRGYTRQGDIFQFMTPGMLTKLTELRKASRLGFVIATNYANHIDNAIKREGRIDKALLCLPPNKAARQTLIRRFIVKSVGADEEKVSWTQKDEKWIEEAAEKTPCYLYEGLRSLVKSASNSLGKKTNKPGAIARELSKHVRGAELTAQSYKAHVKDDSYPQKSLDELFGLMLLEAEVDNSKRPELAGTYKELVESKSPGLECVRSLASSCGLEGFLQVGVK